MALDAMTFGLPTCLAARILRLRDLSVSPVSCDPVDVISVLCKLIEKGPGVMSRVILFAI